ncbi:SMP-30/gluconolactonase/LRE family protein [Nocardioides sp. Leaf374]|uniref:SMP-30/gluconolactonase/LRE family protein n=1 Tax=Nocardioides sp. Leaf374 TaxID=2876560 RepID=UPI001E3076E6|nr:SMP-30/gluconolactonase/LRE family protein [Nocardioides sp. Leaf374]
MARHRIERQRTHGEQAVLIAAALLTLALVLTTCLALAASARGAEPAASAAPARLAAAAPPDFLGTLAGPSQAAMYPSGLEVDAVHDRLVVADTGRDRVLFYSRTGTKLGGFGTYGTEPGQMASPRDVAVDEAGDVYVADAENNRIQKFTATGTFLWQRGGLGTGNETLNTPIGVTWDAANDVLLVASTGQSLVKAWDADGVFRWKSPTGTALGANGIRDVARGPDGRIWLTAYKQHQVKAYDVSAAGVWASTTPAVVLGDGVASGSGEGQLNFPYNTVWSADGDTVYVSDTGNGRIARWDLSGPTPQWLPPFGGRCSNHPQPCEDPPVDAGLFNHLRRVAVDADGAVYGADFWGGGLEVFSPAGASVRSIEGAEAPAPGFAEAYAVDVAPSGQVYVMDRLNHRIQRFRPDGTYVDRVGARGTQPATFSWPEGVTTGPDGSVWAVDTRGDRIERFAADLSPTGVPSYGSTGSETGRFNYPSNADVGADGVVWVADTRNHRLQTFDPASGTFATVGSQGAAPGQLQDPMGVAVTPGAVYVADTGNDRVQKLALDGTPLASFATGLLGPQGLEVAPDGSVWVADTGNSRLVHLSADLVDLGDGFGSRGNGDTQFFDPHDLAFGNDRMYVADTYNDRVQVFAAPGPVDLPQEPLSPVYRDQLSDPGGRAPVYPAGLAVVDGTWYVADSGGSRVVTLDPATGTVTPLTTTGLTDPRDLELDAADPTALWVTDTGGNRVVRLSRTGQQLGTIGGLTQPYGLANDATRVYVANTYANSVRALTRAGATAWTQTTCGGTAFSRPRDVGLADDGRVLVADTDNDRIVVLEAATGACVRTFGTRGTGAVQFKSPRSVTSDGAGGMWVADALNYRVQHLTATGGSLGATPVAAYGDGAQQFRSPHCVTRLPGTTEVAVCDTFNFRLAVYDGAGASPAYDRTVGGTKPTAGGFNGAFAVAYGPDGSLYAADWFNHRIQRFAPDGSYVSQWGGYGPQNGSLIFPRGLLVTAAGDVVVTDSENNRIDVFTAAGAFVRQVKPPAGTTLSRPHQTALDGSGGYWIADTNNNRVVHLASDGAVLGTFPVAGAAAASRPEGVAVDADGTLLVSNTQNNRVERYSTAGALLATVAASGTGSGQVRKPGGLLVTGTGADRRLHIADAGNDRVVVLDATGAVETTFGSTGSGSGQLEQPRGVAVDPTDGDLAVADYGNDRVSLWDPQGTPPPPDTTGPGVTVTAPAAGASLPAGSVAVTGTATDDTSVAGVTVAVQRADGSWLQASGAWGSTRQELDATLAAPGSTSTGFSLSFVAGTAGGHTVSVTARDQAANPATATRSFTVAGADTGAPDTVVTSPAQDAVVAPPTLSLTGTASDPAGGSGVASVTVLVKDRDTGLWLKADGSWGSTTAGAQRLADLAAPGAASTGWSLDVPLATGRYLLTARSRDGAGNQDTTPASRQVTVRASDSVAPDATVTSPAQGAQVPLGAVPLRGGATDDTGVATVLLAVQDTVSKEWLRPDGSFGASYRTVTAVLAAPGATSTTWAFTFQPPLARTYAVTAIARDAAGNQDPTKPRSTFTVTP